MQIFNYEEFIDYQKNIFSTPALQHKYQAVNIKVRFEVFFRRKHALKIIMNLRPVYPHLGKKK